MAKVKDKPDPSASEFARQRLIKDRFYVHGWRGIKVARAWPKKRGTPKSETTKSQNNEFAQLMQHMKFVNEDDQLAARAYAHNTAYAWRDVLFMAMTGSFIEIDELGDGTPTPPPDPFMTNALFAPVMSPPPTMASVGLVTTLNPGTATFTDEPTGIAIQAPPVSGDALRCLVAPIPNPPFRIRVLISFDASAENYQSCGFGFTDLTKFAVLMYEHANAWRLGNVGLWNAVNSFNASVGYAYAAPPMGRIWFEVEQTATHLFYRASVNGSRFVEHYSVAKSASFLGTTGNHHLVFFANRNYNQGTNPCVALMESYQNVV